MVKIKSRFFFYAMMIMVFSVSTACKKKKHSKQNTYQQIIKENTDDNLYANKDEDDDDNLFLAEDISFANNVKSEEICNNKIGDKITDSSWNGYFSGFVLYQSKNASLNIPLGIFIEQKDEMIHGFFEGSAYGPCEIENAFVVKKCDSVFTYDIVDFEGVPVVSKNEKEQDVIFELENKGNGELLVSVYNENTVIIEGIIKRSVHKNFCLNKKNMEIVTQYPTQKFYSTEIPLYISGMFIHSETMFIIQAENEIISFDMNEQKVLDRFRLSKQEEQNIIISKTALYKTFLFIGTRNSGIWIINISDPLNLKYAGHYQNGQINDSEEIIKIEKERMIQIFDLSLFEDFLFVANGTAPLYDVKVFQIIKNESTVSLHEVSHYSHLSETTTKSITLETIENAKKYSVRKLSFVHETMDMPQIFGATENEGIIFFEFNRLIKSINPVQILPYPKLQHIKHIQLSESDNRKILYVVNEGVNSRLDILDITTLDSPTVISSYYNDGALISQLNIDDNNIYISNTTFGFSVLERDTNFELQEKYYFSSMFNQKISSPYQGISYHIKYGNLYYLADSQAGIFVLRGE